MTFTTLLDPGRLSTRLALEQRVEVEDGCGGTTTTFAHVADVWAALEPAGALTRDLADQRQERITHRVTIRYRDDVQSGWRLRKGARLFNIITVFDADETRRYLICRTEEEGR